MNTFFKKKLKLYIFFSACVKLIKSDSKDLYGQKRFYFE